MGVLQLVGARALAASPAKVIYEEMIMTNKLISMSHVEDRLTAQDDPGVWKEILAVLGEEFLQRYRAEQGEKESWFLRIGACSHWVRPHQSRWLAAGEFALPIGYKGAAGWSNGLPEFDWSVILSFDDERWKRVDRFSGKKQIVLRVAVPARTARHKQAAIPTMWSTSHQMTLYGFRRIDQKWLCVAASDERKHGRILYAEATAG
jgi:hypothetical protein